MEMGSRRGGCVRLTMLMAAPGRFTQATRRASNLALLLPLNKLGASAPSSSHLTHRMNTCLTPSVTGFLITRRQGYSIMDKYRRTGSANNMQEGNADTAAKSQQSKEEAIKSAKRKLRGTIPLHHLRSDPPPEVLGITGEGTAPDEDTKGRILEVSLLGAPNAGKSSLANALLQTKVSAVSTKAQTTREEVIGILYDKETDTQVVLTDTPGVVPPRLQKKYGREVAVTGWEALHETGVVMVVVDAARKVDEMTLNIVDRLAREKPRLKASEFLLVLNKMDLVVPRERVLPKVDEYNRDNLFNETFFVSALKETGLDELKKYLISKAVPGDLLYPSDWQSNLNLLDRTEEVIREKIFQRTNGDVPHQVGQENLAWYTSAKDGGYIIHQNVIVPNARLKKILVGEEGRTIKCISMGVQAELEKLCKRKVHLYLEVKVQENKERRR